MKNRAKALPSHVRVYGCTPPLTNIEKVQQQWFLANRYRNQLVEIERSRRDAHKAILGDADEALAAVDGRLASIQASIDKLSAEKKTRNSDARKRRRHPDLDRQIAALKSERKPLQTQRKELKAAAYGNPRNKDALDAANEAAYAAVRAARGVASNEWGLFWGTYLLVEDAAKSMGKGAPPDYRAFHRDNGGCIGVQIQSGGDKPRPTADRLLAGANPYVQLTPEDLPANASRRRRKRPHALLRLCMGGIDP